MRAAAAILGGLLLAGCRSDGTTLQVVVRSPAEAELAPAALSLRWFGPAGGVVDSRLGARRAAPREAVATVAFELSDETDARDRKVLITGLQTRGGAEVASSLGAARIHWMKGDPQTFEVQLRPQGALPDADKDGVPDVIDDDCTGCAPDAGVDGSGDAAGGDGAGVDAPLLPDARAADVADARAEPDAARVDAAVDACGPPPLGERAVSDFESGTLDIAAVGGRGPQGFYDFDDGSGGQHALTVADRADATCENRKALHVTSAGHSAWGSGIGFGLLNKEGGGLSPYDASAYSALRLWARASVAGTVVDVQLVTMATSPEGGQCTVCEDHPRARLTLDTTARLYTLKFSDFKQQGFGMPALATPDLHGLVTVQIFLWKPGPYDVWLDDVAFVRP